MKRLFACCVLVITCFTHTSVAQQMAPSITWSKVFGGARDDKAYSIINTVDNGVLVVGSSLSTDGNVTGHHGANTATDAWVIKISNSGNLEWQRSFGGTAIDNFKSIIRTADGGYICVGTTTSNDGDVSGNHGGEDVWVVKMDRYGQITWQKTYGGTGDDEGMSICSTSDGNALIQANTTTNNNGDVSNFHYSGSGSARNDVWVLKINPANGAIIWQRCFGGTEADVAYDIEDGGSGSFIIATDVSSSDGDFGPNGGNPPRGKLIKISSTYTEVWRISNSRWLPVGIAKTTPGHFVYNNQLYACYPSTSNQNSSASVVKGDSSSPGYSVQGTVSFGGNCSFSVTVEGTSSVAMINPVDNIGVASSNEPALPGYHGQVEGLVTGFKTNSNTASWRKALGGSLFDNLTSVVALSDNEYIVAGYTNSNNGDISGNHGGYDFWVVKLIKANTVKGTVFLDYNLNGSKDANEPFASNILIESEKGGAKTASLTYNGFFANGVDTGIYQTKVAAAPLYYTALPASVSSSFSAYNTSDSIGFALQPVPGKRDYRVYLHSPGAHRPGFDVSYRVCVVNAGTDTLVNKVVKLIKDPRMQYLSAIPAATSVSGDTITWNISYLGPRDTTSIAVQLKISPPPVVSIGNVLISKAIIDTTGDLAKTDNESIFHGFVSGAFDPNDKFESSGNNFSALDVSKGKYIDYTIRFQNTGNDTAFNIVVRDTLDAKLDWNSIEMISASHPYQLSITNGNKAAWTFANIQLADSVHNEPASHGYINYRIRPKSTVIAGDLISNSASIYFDFNLPVKTNTTVNLVKQALPPPSPQVSGLLNGYCSNQGVQKGRINNLPAAGDGISVSVTLSATALPVAADSTFSFNVSTFAAGVHTLQVIFANSTGADTLRMNVVINPAVTPDVNVSANISNVINLIDPVVITAVNAAGGGANPLYTFGKDRNFANVLQAESNNNVLNVLP
ncbi:MAG: hypothetical protein WCF67_18170, partial [Chitinophagaceae bacterium]